MSLLGQQVYANPSTPIWLSANNPVTSGNLTVTGNLIVDGTTLFQDAITSEQTITAEDDIVVKASDDPNITVGRLVGGNTASGRLYVQGATDIAFGKLSQASVNTTLTLGTGGLGDDVMNVAGTLNTIDFTSQTITTNSFSPVIGTATVATTGAGNNAIAFGGNLAGNVLEPNALYMWGMTVFLADSGAGTAAQEIYARVSAASSVITACYYRTYTTVEASPSFTPFSVTGYLRHVDTTPQPLVGGITLGTALTAGSTIQIRDPFLLRID